MDRLMDWSVPKFAALFTIKYALSERADAEWDLAGRA
jgi:hypothetical protein